MRDFDLPDWPQTGDAQEADDDLFVLTDPPNGGGAPVRSGVPEPLLLTSGLRNCKPTVEISGSTTSDSQDRAPAQTCQIEDIICFTAGTRILTAFGDRPIEDLRIGNRLVTRDHGLRPIRWIGKRTVVGRGSLAPIAINPSALDGARAALRVSPRHRMLFTGYRAEILFGEAEVLVAAQHLVNGADIREEPCDEVTYYHLMLDAHEIIYAEGTATESFYAGTRGIGAITTEAREELFTIFPELRHNTGAHGRMARTCLTPHEARLLH